MLQAGLNANPAQVIASECGLIAPGTSSNCSSLIAEASLKGHNIAV
jgi:hypothetical protein